MRIMDANERHRRRCVLRELGVNVEPGQPLWLRSADGRVWHVEAGSEEHANLRANGAFEIDDPDDDSGPPAAA